VTTASIVKGLQNNKIVMFVASEKLYKDSLTSVAKQAQSLFSSIAFLSYRAPGATLESQLAKAGVKTKNCFFIDVLTANVKKASAGSNILFVNSPADLNEVGVAASELIKTGKFHFLLFDGPGAMLLYQDYDIVLQFIHNIITKCRVAGVQLAFFAIDVAANKELIKDLHLFVDEVVDLGAPIADEKLVEAFR